MSHTHDIDNEEPFFQFDPFEGSSSPTLLGIPALHTRTFQGDSPGNRHSHDDLDIPGGVSGQEERPIDRAGKGKEVSHPMPIRPAATVANEHDFFDMSPSGSGLVSSPDDSHSHSPFSSPLTPSPFEFYSLQPPIGDVRQNLDAFGHDDSMRFMASPMGDMDDIEQVFGKGKGKEAELPPTLPPLTFSPTEFGYGQPDWSSSGLITSTPGPSSYGSGCGSLTAANSTPNPGPSQVAETNPPIYLSESPPILRRMPSRRRSLSNLSIHSTRSLAARSMSRIKVKFGPSKVPSNLARKLLFRKREDVSGFSGPNRYGSEAPETRIIQSGEADVGQGNCLMPWCGDPKSLETSVVPFTGLSLEVGLKPERPPLPLYHGSRTLLRGKGRSNSSPLPFSTLDSIPTVSTDVFAPIPFVIRNYFDEVLPRELRLLILYSLVISHEVDHARAVEDGSWTFTQASSLKNKWIGRDRGVRELVKLSRVSKTWQMLVFDGQLWTDLDLHSFPRMPASLILRLAEAGGPFVRSIDLSGHAHLLPATISDMTDSLCLKPSLFGTVPCTRLTAINLQGCSGLTTRSLHHLLIHSTSLQRLSLKGLGAVTNTTCDVLAAYCPQLTSLDMSRCLNMDGNGVRSLADAAISRGEHLMLKELRLSGLKHANDTMMATVGKAAPHLEVLDLSNVRQLHNSALEAFVSCDEGEEDLGVETIQLSARDAGRGTNDSNHYRRRITRLRHLSLSSCILLTDIACSNLAHSVPNLEFLELAGIGAELKDEGLVRLLNTTPFIRRLDLEDASDITDSVLAAITPPSVPHPQAQEATQTPEPEPGHALEQLIISYATEVTDDALIELIHGCKRLRVLEADNTRMGPTTLREFVRVSRKRRMVDARIVAIDCRGVGESVVKGLAESTRPRKGWRAYDARKLKYLDGRDGVVEDLKIGQDECDENRVVLKTFYSWQTVDAVRAAGEKRRKSTSRRAGNDSNESATDSEDVPGRVTRWWSPGGARRSSAAGAPAIGEVNNDGCRIM